MSNDERSGHGSGDGSDDLDRAFEEIISHGGFDDADPTKPEPGDNDPGNGDPGHAEWGHEDPGPSNAERLAATFGRRAWSDPLETEATWEDEGHFVPPDPGPRPPMEPRRRVAWWGLLASPVLMVVTVMMGLTLPPWAFGLLALVFVGSFVYLVATMSGRHDDPWSGDDGAVI